MDFWWLKDLEEDLQRWKIEVLVQEQDRSSGGRVRREKVRHKNRERNTEIEGKTEKDREREEDKT